MVINWDAIVEEEPGTDLATLPWPMVRTVPSPRVWIFIESADESCDLELVGGGDVGAWWRTRSARRVAPPAVCPRAYPRGRCVRSALTKGESYDTLRQIE
jgi:hypothetical protein